MNFDARGDQPDNLFLEPLPVAVVIFVPDHQIHGQPLEAPIRMRLHELAHQFDIGAVGDLQQDDRKIARNGVAP